MLKWVFGADTGPFRRSLNEMRGGVESFAGTAKGHIAGMFAGGAIIAGAAKIISHFARIQDLADRFGESSESIQRVGAAAEQAGTDIEGIAKAMTIATKNAVEAASSGGDLADSFSRLGINAGEFANLPIEDKLKALNAGYNGNTNSAQALADVIKILGKSGAEHIPLLTQGQQALQDQLNNTVVAADGTVAAIARFDDNLDALKQTAMVVGAAIFGSFSFAFGALGLLIGAWYGMTVRNFEIVASAAKEIANVVLNALSGNLSEAGAAGERLGKVIKDGINGQIGEVKDTAAEVGKLFDETFGSSGGKGGGGKDIENIKKSMEEAAASADKRKKIIEEIAKLEEDARVKALSLTEKILDAEKRRAVLAAESIFGDDETKSLEARKEQLKIEQDIAGYRKQQASEKDSSDKDAAIGKEKLADAIDKEQKAKRDNKFAAADDKGKLAILTEERDVAGSRATKKAKEGDATGAADLRTEAIKKQGEIEALMKSMTDKQSDVPKIMTEDIRKAGGGGIGKLISSPASPTDSRLDKVINVLTSIDQKTQPTGTIGPEVS